ncbi:MAG: 2-isopropylmalate synthase [Candidatus Korarchaeum sp.]|nr:2-isopropylmalate synthase [Candidatus Korarchaeum sp.]MDW8035243.1 alpha-isopropylmalate synthase regulatory domain-containing protein [Candidatus Korarchaeum sp.]
MPLRKVRIFDSTLTLGEMVPGVSFGLEGRVEVASHLDTAGVDVIEAGFPSYSESEKRMTKEVVRAVRRISRSGFSPELCALARALKEDVKAAAETEVDSINIFIPVSEVLLRALGISKEEALRRVEDSVSFAKSMGLVVEFTAEDFGRADREFLWRACELALRSGADRVNLSDSLGVILPEKASEVVREAKESLKAPLSVTFFNDLGMATANSIAAALAGADQVHVAVNGLGPKAGVAPLEQVVVALKKLVGIDTNVKMELLTSLSDVVERVSGIPVHEISPVVGTLTFTYEAGVHVRAISMEPSSYELISPEEVGGRRKFWLGSLSGKTAVQEVLREMGYVASEEQVDSILKRIKELSEEGIRITEVLMRSVIEEVLGVKSKWFKVKEWVVVTGSGVTPTATVRVSIGGREVVSSASGVGPVDALTKALISIQGVPRIILRKFRLRAVSTGSEAIGELTIRVLGPSGEVQASGASRDILEASVRALEEALNRVFERVSQ